MRHALGVNTFSRGGNKNWSRNSRGGGRGVSPPSPRSTDSLEFVAQEERWLDLLETRVEYRRELAFPGLSMHNETRKCRTIHEAGYTTAKSDSELGERRAIFPMRARVHDPPGPTTGSRNSGRSRSNFLREFRRLNAG